MLQARGLGCDAERVNIISQKILPDRENVITQAGKTMKAVDVSFFLLRI